MRPELGFHPEQGAVFERSFTEVTRFEVTSIVQRIGENELPDPTPGMEGERRRELVVIDTFERVANERPVRLRRRFDTAEGALALAAELEGIDEEYQADLESSLADQTVTFVWDEDDERYQLDTQDGELEELLGGLSEDLDLRALLPEEQLAEGDRWTVDAAELTDLLAPAGNLSLHFGYEPDGEFQVMTVEDLTAASLSSLADHPGEIDGELVAEWKETRGAQGEHYAIIELSLEATLDLEPSDRLAQRLELSELETERQDLRLRSHWELEGRGELRWNLESGTFSALDLEIDFTATTTVSWMRPFGQRELQYEMEIHLDGETELTAECDAH